MDNMCRVSEGPDLCWLALVNKLSNSLPSHSGLDINVNTGTLNKGHLSNEDTACCPNYIKLCKAVYKTASQLGTPLLQRSSSWVLMVSAILYIGGSTVLCCCTLYVHISCMSPVPGAM